MTDDQVPALLAGVSPEEIDELFSRDPLDLTPKEVDTITWTLVEVFRAEREIWEREQSKARITGKKSNGTRTRKLQKKAALEAIKNASSVKIDLNKIVSPTGGKK